MVFSNRFFDVAQMILPFKQLLVSVPKNVVSDATEIRIRAGRPIAIETVSGRYICGTRIATIEEIYLIIKNFCNYSIHSCQREFREGWITLKGGHRAGFTGTAYIKNGVIENINDISSINVRIAREHIGISDNLFSKTINCNDFKGLIIAGAPLSGKTTLLRDYCRNLGSLHKTALLDERGEIAAVYKGVPQNNIGFNTDVLNCFPKKDSIEQAIRVLSPEYIVCDEIGSDAETLLKYSGNGIKTIVSVHCENIIDAVHNRFIYEIINHGMVNFIVFLENKKSIGNMKGLWRINNGEDISSCNNSNNLLYQGNNSVCKNEDACLAT